jgi:hypothetical protein
VRWAGCTLADRDRYDFCCTESIRARLVLIEFDLARSRQQNSIRCAYEATEPAIFLASAAYKRTKGASGFCT